jgi:hypothetical protein
MPESAISGRSWCHGRDTRTHWASEAQTSTPCRLSPSDSAFRTLEEHANNPLPPPETPQVVVVWVKFIAYQLLFSINCTCPPSPPIFNSILNLFSLFYITQ